MPDVAALRLRYECVNACPYSQVKIVEHVPSVKLLIASILRCRARNCNVTSGDPSRIMRWTVMRPLKTTVHVESRKRYCSVRKTSAMPASPE